MAVAFDTTSEVALNGVGNTLTHTVTGTNPFLLVGIEADITSNASNVTGATYNGVAMTQVSTGQSGTGRWEYAFYLVNPATGSHSISVSTTGSTYIQYIVAASYTGVVVVDNTGVSTGTGGTTDFANTLTTTHDNCWHVGYYACGTGRPFLAGTGTTLRGSGGDANNGWFRGDNNAAITPVGSNTINAKTTAGSGGAVFFGVTISPTSVVSGSLPPRQITQQAVNRASTY